MANALADLLGSKPVYRDRLALSFDEWLDENSDDYSYYSFDDIERMFQENNDRNINIMGIVKEEWEWLLYADSDAYWELVNDYQDTYFGYCFDYRGRTFYCEDDVEDDYRDYCNGN